MERPTIVQFNLSPTLGGAEVYTAFFSRALAARGWRTRVVVNAAARFWNDLDLRGVRLSPSGAGYDVLRDRDIALIHAPVPAASLDALRGRYVVGLAHQALYDATRPAYYDRADLLLAVSRHVIATLDRHGLDRVHRSPLYGVADLDRGQRSSAPSPGPLFDADARKPRDRIVAALDRTGRALAAPRRYERRPGLTLGVVSRLAPLKQFPALFEQLVPILMRHPSVNLDFFGAAVGYKSLLSVRRAVAPLGERVRFWGHQRDVASAYRALDYLLTGLPEREALGLNAIESCLAGTPVLAVAAPPFSETMSDGETGFLYVDPRHDGARDFERVLTGIESGALCPDLAVAATHLVVFSFERFVERVDAAMDEIAASAMRREAD
jgi:glycosyltransferase involved in cell wall biosynthesis